MGSYLMEKIQTEVVKIKSYVNAFLSYFGLTKEKEIEKEKIEEEEEVEVEEEERSISISMEELNERIEELTGAMADAVVDHVLQNKRGGRIGFCLQFPILAPLIFQAFLSTLFAFLNSPLLVFPWISLVEEIEQSGSGSGDGSGSGSGSGSGIDPKSWTDDEPGDVDERDPRAFGLLFGPGGLFAPGGPKGPAAGGDAGDDADLVMMLMLVKMMKEGTIQVMKLYLQMGVVTKVEVEVRRMPRLTPMLIYCFQLWP